MSKLVCSLLLSPPLSLFPSSNILLDAFEETTQDLESARTRLEVEVEESKKTNQRENEAREAAETARTRIQRELAELREKYDEEVIIRTNLERCDTSPVPCPLSPIPCSSPNPPIFLSSYPLSPVSLSPTFLVPPLTLALGPARRPKLITRTQRNSWKWRAN